MNIKQGQNSPTLLFWLLTGLLSVKKKVGESRPQILLRGQQLVCYLSLGSVDTQVYYYRLPFSITIPLQRPRAGTMHSPASLSHLRGNRRYLDCVKSEITYQLLFVGVMNFGQVQKIRFVIVKFFWSNSNQFLVILIQSNELASK